MPNITSAPTLQKHSKRLTLQLSSLFLTGILAGCNVAPKLATIDKIPELMEAFDVHGLAVTAVARDKIIVSEGFGVTADGNTYSSNSTCGLFSATKVLASITYARLEQDKRISLRAPLEHYITDAPEPWKTIPFYRLLNHTSGIPMVVNRPDFSELASNPKSGNEDVYRMVKDAPLDYQPGQYSRYRQSGYAVGEMILATKLEQSFDALVDQYITAPAGMTNTKHPSQRDQTQPALLMSAGGYETTANDMARLFLGINNGSVIEAKSWESLLLNNEYRFDNYSLGTIIENRNGVLTLGHRGGGARANIRYAPDEKVGVMVCTDDTQNNELAISLAQMLLHEIITGDVPTTPLLVALAGHQTMTAEEVIAAYTVAMRQTGRYDLSESERLLNTIGYAFLAREQAQDAIAVFALNTELFPTSPNAYDSLGEAMLAAGDTAAALLNYRKVLTLEPGNVNASTMIEKIETLQNP